MSRPYKIAIAGSGSTGLAAACFLHRSGHDITLYEKFVTPKPVGAGLLLQPTGLHCLEQLGLREKMESRGARINGLHGVNLNDKTVFDLRYEQLNPDYYGLGIHRGNLFGVLYDEVNRLGIPVITDHSISSCEQLRESIIPMDARGNALGTYDLLIDASGYRSQLRTAYAHIALDKSYPYGAIWGVVDVKNNAFPFDSLEQKYVAAKHMLGVLPVGNRPDTGVNRGAAFFWSIRIKDYDTWKAGGLDAWKQKVLTIWPETEPLLNQFTDPEQLTLAQYGDVVLKKWYQGKLAFAGDAGHSTSPQLGQGANLGLMDAMVLSSCIEREPTIEDALEAYSAERKNHIRFYQMASRWMTPFFQSDMVIAPMLRYWLFDPMAKIPYVRKEMLRSLAGVKDGLFSALDLSSRRC